MIEDKIFAIRQFLDETNELVKEPGFRDGSARIEHLLNDLDEIENYFERTEEHLVNYEEKIEDLETKLAQLGGQE